MTLEWLHHFQHGEKHRVRKLRVWTDRTSEPGEFIRQREEILSLMIHARADAEIDEPIARLPFVKTIEITDDYGNGRVIKVKP